MRLLSFQREGRDGFGALTPDGVADLSGGAWPSLKALIAGGGVARLPDLIAGTPDRIGLDELTLRPPIPEPAKIFCLGMSYRAHCLELGVEIPKHPSLFVRFPTSFVGHGQAVVRPFLSEAFDFEAELGVVIGTGGRHIPVDQAMAHVAGYTCVGEHSIRDYQRHAAQVTAGKNFDRTGAIGPWLTTIDEVPDPAALTLVGRLNGVEVQRTSVSDLVFKVAEIIAYVSSFTRLEPGDLIATGTPAGVGALRNPPLFMKPGDVFEVDIPGVGLLANPVVDETRPETRS